MLCSTKNNLIKSIHLFKLFKSILFINLKNAILSRKVVNKYLFVLGPVFQSYLNAS